MTLLRSATVQQHIL